MSQPQIWMGQIPSLLLQLSSGKDDLQWIEIISIVMPLLHIFLQIIRIMEDRKGQENFQLIVITHDERFAQLIGQRQHAEKYYRISKDD